MEAKIITILKRYDFITNAFIFGSYAKNKQTSLSDIDIAIQTNKDIDLFTIGEIIADLESIGNIKIDLVLCNELYKYSPLLAYNIYQNHKILYIQNTKEYNDFKENSLHYYLDFKPVIDEQNTAFLERVKNGNIAKTKIA